MTTADIPSPDVSGNPVSEKAYVYVITAGDEAVKIGVAKNVPRRLKGLQTGHSRKLSVFCHIVCASRTEAYGIETRAHALLKASILEGEWFAVSPEAAREAMEKAIGDIKEDRRRKKEMLKSNRYVPPTVIQAEPWMRDPLDAIHYAAQRDGEMKREYLVDFGHCIIFVRCGMDRRTGQRTFMTNDVTHLYIQEEETAA